MTFVVNQSDWENVNLTRYDEEENDDDDGDDDDGGEKEPSSFQVAPGS